MTYRRRLEQDLDRWIEEGLVPQQSRAAILADTNSPSSLSAANALAVIGGLLLGAAVIAFVAANWGGIPRAVRFGMILTLFLGVSGAGAWASRGRPLLANILLAVAALIYAAAIGLTGQIFDLAGDPQTALRGAGLAAALLAVAGRSSAAAVAALLLLALGEFTGGFRQDETRWLIFAAPLGGFLAWRWKSIPLTHAASLAMILGAFSLAAKGDTMTWLLAAAAGLAALAAPARLSGARLGAIAAAWFIWGALAFYGFGGVEAKAGLLVAHRAGWLLLSGGVIALGLHDRQGTITAAGVTAMIAAVCLILSDLGLGLMAAAGLFALCAVVALAAGAVLHRRGRA